MLVLTRKPGERLRIKVGDTIAWLSIERITRRSGEVRIGFDAPAEFEIAREEVIATQVKRLEPMRYNIDD